MSSRSFSISPRSFWKKNKEKKIQTYLQKLNLAHKQYKYRNLNKFLNSFEFLYEISHSRFISLFAGGKLVHFCMTLLVDLITSITHWAFLENADATFSPPSIAGSNSIFKRSKDVFVIDVKSNTNCCVIKANKQIRDVGDFGLEWDLLQLLDLQLARQGLVLCELWVVSWSCTLKC